MDGMPLDDWRNRSWNVQERIHICLRKQFTKHLKASFPASHPREPVMNEGDFHSSLPSSSLLHHRHRFLGFQTTCFLRKNGYAHVGAPG